jgi:hypothetical protein
MPQNFETRLVRLRPRAAVMIFPTLVLAASSFFLMYFSELASPEVYQIIFWVAVGSSALFWLVPLLNWLAASLVVTDHRVIHRSGLFGLRKRELQLRELSSIALERTKPFRGKVISMLKVNGQELVVSGYSRSKLLAAAIEAEASKTL